MDVSRPDGGTLAGVPEPRTCFICLDTDQETRGQAWVTPCPCTLDVHEACMLKWISEVETSAGGRKKIRCPACNSRIYTIEPFDVALALRDRCSRLYKQASPFFLMSIFTAMGMAGSAYYGLQSMLIIAGVPRTIGWLGLDRAVRYAPRERLMHWRQGFDLFRKLLLLNLIAPGLLLHRALPNIMNLAALPVSFLYVTTRRTPPTWPPSPTWTIAFTPYINYAYTAVYNNISWGLEKKLKMAAQGITAGAVAPPAGLPQPNPNGAVQAQWQEPQQQRPDNGVGATLRRVGAAIADLVGNDENIALENDRMAAALGNGRNIEFQLEIVVGNDDEEVVEEEEDEAEFADHAGDDHGGEEPVVQVQARRPRNQNGGDNGANGNEDNNAENDAANEQNNEANRMVGTFSDIVTAMTTQLLFPRICATMGTILKWSLPRGWVTKPMYREATGLLQEQWGRSFVGGCLFVVLRDVFHLYTKYRRIYVMRHRRIKNVDRRKSARRDDDTVVKT